MDASGVRQLGDRLADQDAATTIRIRDGRLLTTDGPYAETKEQIVGFDIVECEDLDQAIETASKHPMATYGLIEVRPFWMP
jgi:hypothetical protein